MNGRTAALTLALTASVDAFWRLECPSLSGKGRVDPLVDPGKAAAHAHTIQGGNNFGMSSKPSDLLDSTCTSCSVKQDKSAYWTPILYFQDDSSGELEEVPQALPFLAYYWLFGDNVHAFPQGFQMLAGDTNQREFPYAKTDPPKPWSGDMASQKSLAAHAVGFNCLNYSPGYQAEQTLTRHFLPNKTFLDTTCKDGLKLELSFPSCWDGKDFTLDTQKDHLAYPDQVFNGNCPKGFDTRLVSLLYETKWSTNQFAGRNGRFVFSNGDPTGFGYHGDFMAAWEDGVLEQAVKQCTDESGEQTACKVFDISEGKCEFDMPSQVAGDNINGPMKSLPGNVQIVDSGYVNDSDHPNVTGNQGGYSGSSDDGSGDGSGKQQSNKDPSSAKGGNFAEKVQKPNNNDQGGNDQGAQGGNGAPPSSSTSSSPPGTTAAPASSAASGPDGASVKWVTSGQNVYKVYVVNEKVTVTQTGGSPPTGVPAGNQKRAHDRHMHRHLHEHHH